MYNLKSNPSISVERHLNTKKNVQYQINPYEYNNIKSWLEQSNKNHYGNISSPEPTIKNQAQYTTSTYVYSFKMIYLDDAFVNKNYRMINSIGNEGNGLIVMANIFDEVKKCYITQSFERRNISCLFDDSGNCIKLSESLIMAFYIEHHKNIMKFGQSFLVNLQLVTSFGEIFQLGIVSLDLSHRPRHIMKDYQLKRLNQNVGKVQFMIDSPDSKSYPLKHLIPPNRIITQEKQNTIPPCNKYSLHNKILPFSISSDVIFPILIQNIRINITNFSQFLITLQKFSPFFVDFHYENVSVEIQEYRLLMGYHNTWMFLNSLGSIAQSKQTQSKQMKASPTKNKKKQFTSENSSLNKNKSMYESLSTLHSAPLSKYISLKPKNHQENPDQVFLQPTEPQRKLLLQYFHGTNGHLALVLQAKIKYTLNTTIKQEKSVTYNLGWHPIVFDLQQTQSTLQVPLITHEVKLPGYEFSLLKTDKNILQGNNFGLSYQALNNNENLKKIIRKESHKMMAYGSLMNLTSLSDIDRGRSTQNINSFADKIGKQLTDNIETEILKEQQQRMNRKKRVSIGTETSIGPQQKAEEISHLLRLMSSNIRSRLSPIGAQIPIPSDDTTYFPSKSQILHKNIKINVKFYGLLPHTETIDAEQPIFRAQHYKQLPSPDYYIPRTIFIELFIHCSHFSFLAQIDNSKKSVKYCVPIQMHCSKVTDYYKTNKKISYTEIQKGSIIVGKATTEFQLEFSIDNEKQYNQFIQAPILCQVFDAENYQFYAAGSYPCAALLSESSINQSKQSLQSNEENNTAGWNIPSFNKKLSQKHQEKDRTISKQSENLPRGQIDKMQTIDSKKLVEQLFHEANNKKVRNFKIELKKYEEDKYEEEGNLMGSLLFTANSQFQRKKIEQDETAVGSIIDQFKIENVAKELSTKERQMLRINNYNKFGGGQGNLHIDKTQLISKYKEKNQKKFIDRLVKNQCHNDITIKYQTGVPIYQWLQFTNTDTTGNDIFTFEIDCEYVELVVDNVEYNQVAAIQTGKQSKQALSTKPRKNPYLTFFYSQNNYGYYEGRVVFGEKYSLLLKVYHEEWSHQIQKISIIYLITKRNKLPYSKYKIRLDYCQPLISHIEHINCLFKLTNTGLQVDLPEEKLFKKFSENMKSLTANVSYSKKNRCLVIEASGTSKKRNALIETKKDENDFSVEEDFIPSQGKLYDILVGFYWDKKAENLMKTVLIRAEILSGEEIKAHLGQITTCSIPYYQPNLPINSRIYRIETSHNHMLYRNSKKNGLNFKILTNNLPQNTLLQSSQPQITICPMRPTASQNLVVSVISLQNRLLRKYLIKLSCEIPLVHQYEQVKMSGIKGQKSIILIRNPYQIDFGFYFVSSCSQFLKFYLIGSNEDIQNQKDPFKISARSQLKVCIEAKSNITINHLIHEKKQQQFYREEYAALIDFNEHVIGVYRILFIEKQSHRASVRVHEEIAPVYQNQLFSLFGAKVSQRTI